MYKFSYFTETDKDSVLAFMQENYFATIVAIGEYPVATHIPLDIEMKDDGKLFLSGHMMRNTDHHKAFSKNEHVLVIFNGPHCYVSASWYSTPQIGSTWNYMTVHAKGKMIFGDEQATINAVRNITNRHEGMNSPSFDKLSDEYVQHMVKAIVAFEIEVTSFDNVFKLSQNRDKASQENIIAELLKRGDAQSAAIAKEMEKRLK